MLTAILIFSVGSCVRGGEPREGAQTVEVNNVTPGAQDDTTTPTVDDEPEEGTDGESEDAADDATTDGETADGETAEEPADPSAEEPADPEETGRHR